MHKQRGQGNTGLIFVLVAIAIVFIIAAIALHQEDQKPKHHHGKHTVVKGEFLTPTPDGRGRYAYQNDGGDWYIYYWMMTSNNSYSYATPPPLTGYALPSGGQWAKVSEEPDEDEVVEQENEEIAETNTNVPETESDWQTENQTDIENQSVEPENTTEPSSTPESSPSDSGSDSGGDSGGDGGSSD
jgi:hypothetical protein